MKTSRINLFRVILPLLSAVALIAMPAGFAKNQAAERARTEAAKKARHYFLLGCQADAEGKIDQSYEYYKKAWQTDPDYPEAAYCYGLTRLHLFADTLGSDTVRATNLSLARPLVEKYPGDYFTVNNYAYFTRLEDDPQESVRVFKRLTNLVPQRTNALLYLAQYHQEAGDFDDAIEALDRYERAEGSNFSLTLHKVNYHIAGGDTLGAIAEADSFIRNVPGSQALLLKGQVYEFLQKPDSALKYFLKAEQIEPEDGAIKVVLAGHYLQQGDSLSFDRKIYESMLCEDLNAEAKIGTMSDYLQQIIIDKADTRRGDTLFNVLREQFPHDPRILSLAARYSAAKSDFPKAIEETGYAIDLDGQNQDLWQNLMLYQLSDNKTEDAMKTFHKAEKLFGDSASTGLRLLFASAAVQCDSIDTAIATYQKLLQSIDPRVSIGDTITDKSKFATLSYPQLMNISSFYQMAGDAFYAAKPPRLDETYLAYDDALFFNPDNEMVLNNYAYFIVETEKVPSDSERFQKAKAMSEQALKQDPDNETFLDTYAWILFKEGNYKEARKHQAAAIEASEKKDGLSAELYSHMGDILFMDGDPDQAVEYWEKALKLEPDNELLKKKVTHRTFFYK